MDADQCQADPPELEWRGAVPVATRYGDGYHQADGAAEARHVYLGGNGLPGRLRDGFAVGELGFGTGLTALVLAAAAEARGVTATMTSFEAHPLPRDAMRRALAPFPGLASEALLDAWPAERVRLPGLALRVVIGDARDALPRWDGTAEAWFLDGFAPARNPAMWEPSLLAAVGARTPAGGTCATFTAAGHVRRALEAAGFAVERRPGFGAKRHMTAGVRR